MSGPPNPLCMYCGGWLHATDAEFQECGRKRQERDEAEYRRDQEDAAYIRARLASPECGDVLTGEDLED